MKFRKKPVIIEAVQWDGTLEAYTFCQDAFQSISKTAEGKLHNLRIKTLEGTLRS